MDLLLLDGVFDYNNNPAYRGTDRSPPRYHEELDESHPANRAWLWLAEEASGGVVRDLTIARKIVNAYQQLSPPEHLDIVEVTRGKSTPTTKGIFLGFDLSHEFSNSFLSGGVRQKNEQPAVQPCDNNEADDIRCALQPLVDLMGEFFVPRLNEYGLINDYDTACFWLRCAMALQKIQPGFFEFGNYEITGVWEVETI